MSQSLALKRTTNVLLQNNLECLFFSNKSNKKAIIKLIIIIKKIEKYSN